LEVVTCGLPDRWSHLRSGGGRSEGRSEGAHAQRWCPEDREHYAAWDGARGDDVL